MDWPKVIAEEAKLQPIIRISDLAKRYRLSVTTIQKALSRQVQRGFVERVSPDVYVNKLARVDPRELVAVLRPNSYISLESALSEYGISTQLPTLLTCISDSFTRDINTESIHIAFHTIKNDLFWGFTEKKGRYFTYRIAEPEKAVLDWIYIRRQDSLPTATDEFNLDGLDRKRFLDYVEKYPSSVKQIALYTLAGAAHLVSQ
jgi:predicted transcriptional regulator of viral defense system